MDSSCTNSFSHRVYLIRLEKVFNCSTHNFQLLLGKMDQIWKKLHFKNLINLHVIKRFGNSAVIIYKSQLRKFCKYLNFMKIIQLNFLSENWRLCQKNIHLFCESSVEWMKEYIQFCTSEYLPEDDPVCLTNIQSRAFMFCSKTFSEKSIS
jgi:hypothetical protein